MKKLLALLTAPLTMTACIDLTEPDAAANIPGTGPGAEAEVETEDKDKGFSALRAAYHDTNFVLPLDGGDTLVSTSTKTVSTNTGSCGYVETMEGNFNSTAELSYTASDIMETVDGTISEDSRSAIYTDETPFFAENWTSLGGHKYSTKGYISYEINDNQDQVEMTSNEYLTQDWDGYTGQVQIDIKEGTTQIWRSGLIEDVAQITGSPGGEGIYAHRTISSTGERNIWVFNTVTGSSYHARTGEWQGAIDTGTDCYVAGEDNSSFVEYIDMAKELDWINSTLNFNDTDYASLFTVPTFEHSIEDIDAKLA